MTACTSAHRLTSPLLTATALGAVCVGPVGGGAVLVLLAHPLAWVLVGHWPAPLRVAGPALQDEPSAADDAPGERGTSVVE
ncbi:hypothetical protein AB0935_17745 [Streptomyces sp. NPDC007027]|uniref:hypothetical protein n=1 Tax=Streptomyces sp. NPDC007027 TaxID=3157086 RepID=UPI003456713D